MTNVFVALVEEESATGIGRQLVRVVPSSTDVCELEIESKIDASEVGEGGLFPTDATVSSSSSYSVKKIGVVVSIPYVDVEDKQFSLIEQKLRAGVRAVVRAEDKLILEELLSDSSVSSRVSVTPGMLQLDDLVSAAEEIESEGYPANFVVLNPEQMQDLRTSAADKPIEVQFLERKICGDYEVSILVSEEVTAGTALVLNAPNAVTLIERKPISKVEERDFLLDRYLIRIRERVRPVVVRPSLVRRITGC